MKDLRFVVEKFRLRPYTIPETKKCKAENQQIRKKNDAANFDVHTVFRHISPE